jgi:hypothetical protein
MGSGRECLTLGGEMGNTDCVHYIWQQGQYVEQKGGCQDNFFPQSARYFDMANKGVVCDFFDGYDCNGPKVARTYHGEPKICAAEAVFGNNAVIQTPGTTTIKSFRCTPKK